MYGKLFATMFTGSLYGKDALIFAIMAYAIANQDADSVVELNPALLAGVFGQSTPDAVEAAIRFLCEPDPLSRSQAEEGRRLVKVGAFAYSLVNGPLYRGLRDADQRREQAREAMRRHRKRKAGEELPPLANDVHGEPPLSTVIHGEPSLAQEEEEEEVEVEEKIKRKIKGKEHENGADTPRRAPAALPPDVQGLVDFWHEHVGVLTPAKARPLAALAKEHGAEVVRAALVAYVSPEGPAAKGRDRRVEWFAADFHRWRQVAENDIDAAPIDATGVPTNYVWPTGYRR